MFGDYKNKYEGPFRKKDNWVFTPNYLANKRWVYESAFGPSTVVEIDLFGRVKRVKKTWFPRG